jgi:hypothetical protein
MATLSVPNSGNNEFRVVNATSIEYLGTVYSNVTSIAFPDGTIKTPAELIEEAGGTAYQASELKRCVKVEGYYRDANVRQIFTIYSYNSRQINRNSVAAIPGGAWVEMFNFLGDADSNHILAEWKRYFDTISVDYTTAYDASWIGFKIAYGTSERRSYVLTKVNDFDEESIPSAPVEVDCAIMNQIEVSGLFRVKPPVTVSIQHNYVPIKELRLYRSVVNSSGQASYKLVPNVTPTSIAPNVVVGAFPAVATTVGLQYGWKILDESDDDKLGETLPSALWDPPIYNECLGLTEWRNGMLAAYWKNSVKLFEPYRPFAQPRDYEIALPSTIVGLVPMENALIAFTETVPYLLTGSHPSNVTYDRIENGLGAIPGPVEGTVNLPSRAHTRTPIGLVYRTIDGPYLLNGQSARPIGRQIITRDEWVNDWLGYHQAMRMLYLDGHVMVYISGTPAISFLMPIDNDGVSFTRYDVDGGLTWGISHFVHRNNFAAAPTLIHAANLNSPATLSVPMWPGQDRREWRYQSRVATLPTPENLGVCEVIGECNRISDTNKTLQVQVRWDNGSMTKNLTFSGNDEQRFQFRLPVGKKSRHWAFDIWDQTGDVVVKQVLIASTPGELARG